MKKIFIGIAACVAAFLLIAFLLTDNMERVTVENSMYTYAKEKQKEKIKLKEFKFTKQQYFTIKTVRNDNPDKYTRFWPADSAGTVYACDTGSDYLKEKFIVFEFLDKYGDIHRYERARIENKKTGDTEEIETKEFFDKKYKYNPFASYEERHVYEKSKDAESHRSNYKRMDDFEYGATSIAYIEGAVKKQHPEWIEEYNQKMKEKQKAELKDSTNTNMNENLRQPVVQTKTDDRNLVSSTTRSTEDVKQEASSPAPKEEKPSTVAAPKNPVNNKIYVDDNTYYISPEHMYDVEVVMTKGNIVENYRMNMMKDGFIVLSVKANTEARTKELQAEVGIKQYYKDNPRTAKIARSLGILE